MYFRTTNTHILQSWSQDNELTLPRYESEVAWWSGTHLCVRSRKLMDVFLDLKEDMSKEKGGLLSRVGAGGRQVVAFSGNTHTHTCL